jgi:glycosyltransferase involved in cell wall biosynthesis
MATISAGALAPSDLASVVRPVPATAGLSICIPVYNEEGAILETLHRCLALADALGTAGVGQFEVIAVDDGSIDRSAEMIASCDPRVRLIRHPRNAGYGAALKTGFAAAQYDLIGFLDADATYPPEEFPALCRAILEGGADLAIGSRMAGASTEMPAVRRLGNTIFARLLTLLGRTPVTDSASGMRVFRREVLDLLSPLPDGLNLTPVMSTRAVHERVTVAELPIPYRERVGDSKLSVARDGMRFLQTMVGTALAYNPVRVFGVVGLVGIAIALAILAGVVGLRLQGFTELGPFGTFAIFAALVCGVAGVNLFSLGASFNYLVSLFYRRPIRQGLFRSPLSSRPVEQLFLPAGAAIAGLGLVVAFVSLALSLRGWSIERLWLYLTGSAMLMLVGLQLGTAWLMAAVLRQVSEREIAQRPSWEGAAHTGSTPLPSGAMQTGVTL